MKRFIVATICIAMLIISGASPAQRRVMGGPVGPVDLLAVAPSNPNVVAAVKGNRIWVTINLGSAFKTLHLPTYAPPPRMTSDIPSPEAASETAPSTTTAATSLIQERSRLSSEQSLAFEAVTPETGGQLTTPLAFAVSDDGRYAIARPNTVIFQRAKGGAPRIIPVDGIKQVAFDPQGVLWGLTEKALIAVSDITAGRSVQRRGSRGANKLLPGPGPQALTLLGPLGLVVVSTTPGEMKPVHQLQISNLVDAVAARPATGDDPLLGAGWYILKNGRLARLMPDGTVTDLGAVPPTTSKILVDGHLRLAVFSDRSGWQIEDHGRLVTRRIATMALHADGTFWFSEDAGLTRAPIDAQPRQGIAAFHDDAAPPRFDPSHTTLLPPTCRRLRVSPLPTLDVSAALYSNDRTSVGVDTRETHPGAGIDLGVRLTWQLSPIQPNTCRRRWEAYHRDEQALRERLAALTLRRFQDETRPPPGDLQAAIDQRIDRDKTAAIVRILKTLY